jgi:diguanylate cyclase (GGDEF)-like protein
MMLSGLLWPGFEGFLAGAACVGVHAGRVRARLSRLRRAAEHDVLTGLPNRAALRRRYEAGRAAGRPDTLVLLDLNDFKEVNDTYGHPVGDRLLVEVARRLAEERPIGSAGRLGGDEFLILLPDSPGVKATACIQALLARVATPIAVDDDSTLYSVALTVSASAGMAEAKPGCSWATQLRQADIALYHAKKYPGGLARFEDGMRYPPRARSDRRRPGMDASPVLQPLDKVS